MLSPYEPESLQGLGVTKLSGRVVRVNLATLAWRRNLPGGLRNVHPA
jgi:hypothetical protein